MNGNNNAGKSYTFINMKKCVGNNGNEYTGVTLEALVVKPGDLRTMPPTPEKPNGNSVINFSCPIHNREKYIGSMCGKTPTVDADNTCWGRVTLWGRTAERFSNFVSKYPKCVLVITGAIKVEEREKDGKVFTNLNITADDFTVLRTYGGAENGADVPKDVAANAAAAPAAAVDAKGFMDIDDDEELPF